MPEKPNWIDRYQDSDHHTDRLVRTKTSYEDKTGLSFPDPDPREIKEMRGRRFRCEPGMVLLTRRAHSVPPTLLDVHYDFGLGSASRKAQRLSDYVNDDHDSIRLASRRHDEALMRDITNRMEAGDYGRSRQVRSRTIRASSPPAMSTSVYHDVRHRRASSVPPSFSDADYYDFDIRHEPLRHYSHYSHYSPYWHYEEPVRHYTPISRYVTERVRAGSEPPEIRRSYAPAYTSSSSDLAVRQARASLGRLERELGTGWDDPYYSTDPYYDYPAIRPYKSSYLSDVYNEPYRSVRPYSSYVPRSYSLPRRSRTAAIEARLESMVMPEYTPTSYYGLRSRTAEARDKLDRHKVMLDRYTPLYMGPVGDVGTVLHHARLCRMLGRGPGKCYVRPRRTPATSITRLFHAHPYDAWPPLGFVTRLMNSEIPILLSCNEIAPLARHSVRTAILPRRRYYVY